MFSWFSNGLLVKLSDAPFVVADARYVVAIKPLKFLWSLRVDKSGKVRLLTRTKG